MATDGLNRLVETRGLAAVFDGRQPLADWLGCAKELQQRLTQMQKEPYGELLPNDAISALDNAIKHVRLAMPHQVCWCQPGAVDCVACKDKHWLSVSEVLEWETSPDKALAPQFMESLRPKE